MYFERNIDKSLSEWVSRPNHKPLLLRGARQVGKSTAVRHLGEQFEYLVEINFEKTPQYKQCFVEDLDVNRIVSQLAVLSKTQIIPGKTLLFLDEVQECPQAIMSLRFFKEDMPELHVIAAGSLLEFALQNLPTFGVGRIHSMFVHPMTFDEFLLANGEKMLMDAYHDSDEAHPLSEPFHQRLISLLRTFILVGGMPESVACWVQSHDYTQCQEILDDIVLTYEDDFSKYKKNADPVLLRNTLHSAAVQATQKFVFSRVGDYKAIDVRKALDMLFLSGILIPVTNTSGNGIPLGAEADQSYRKVLLLDTGLMLRILHLTNGNDSSLTSHILTSSANDLVNKGPMAELFVGLEIIRNSAPNMRHELYYWTRTSRNSLAEVDYLLSDGGTILPVEVKAGVQGGMKSLWMFMRDKGLTKAVRCSLENFGSYDMVDTNDAQQPEVLRHIEVLPIYAASRLSRYL